MARHPRGKAKGRLPTGGVCLRAETARWFAVLAAVPFIMVLGNSMLIPVLPTIQQRLRLSAVETGFIITAFSLPAGLTIPLAGVLSDRLGRKAVMVPALVLFGLGGLAAGLAAWLLPGRVWPLLAARVVQGVGAGGTYQLAMALAGDVFQSQERTRALGLLEASNGLGKVVSPLLGAAAAWVVWFLPFFVYGALALPVAAAVFWVVREPDRRGRPPAPGEYLRRLREIAAERGAMLAASYAGGLVALFSLFGVLSYVSDRLEQDWSLAELARGGLIAIPVGLMAAVAYLGGAWLQRSPGYGKAMAAGGLAVAAAALAAMAFIRQSLVPLMAASAGLGLGVGAALPAINTAITSAASRQQRGVVTSLYGTVRFGGVAAGPPLFGLAEQDGMRLLVFGASALAVAGAAWALASVRVATPRGAAGGQPAWTPQPASGAGPGDGP